MTDQGVWCVWYPTLAFMFGTLAAKTQNTHLFFSSQLAMPTCFLHGNHRCFSSVSSTLFTSWVAHSGMWTWQWVRHAMYPWLVAANLVIVGIKLKIVYLLVKVWIRMDVRSIYTHVHSALGYLLCAFYPGSILITLYVSLADKMWCPLALSLYRTKVLVPLQRDSRQKLASHPSTKSCRILQTGMASLRWSF